MIIYHALRFFHLISGASHFSKTFEDRGEWSNIREVCIIILYNVCKLIVGNDMDRGKNSKDMLLLIQIKENTVGGQNE